MLSPTSIITTLSCLRLIAPAPTAPTAPTALAATTAPTATAAPSIVSPGNFVFNAVIKSTANTVLPNSTQSVGRNTDLPEADNATVNPDFYGDDEEINAFIAAISGENSLNDIRPIAGEDPTSAETSSGPETESAKNNSVNLMIEESEENSSNEAFSPALDVASISASISASASSNASSASASTSASSSSLSPVFSTSSSSETTTSSPSNSNDDDYEYDYADYASDYSDYKPRPPSLPFAIFDDIVPKPPTPDEVLPSICTWAIVQCCGNHDMLGSRAGCFSRVGCAGAWLQDFCTPETKKLVFSMVLKLFQSTI